MGSAMIFIDRYLEEETNQISVNEFLKGTTIMTCIVLYSYAICNVKCVMHDV